MFLLVDGKIYAGADVGSSDGDSVELCGAYENDGVKVPALLEVYLPLVLLISASDSYSQ